MLRDLMGGIPDGVSVIGLVALLFVSLQRGWLVTRREHQDMLRDKDAQIEYHKREADIRGQQVDKFLSNENFTHAILESFKRKSVEEQ